MAYDESLAERIRAVLGARPDVTEKKMFGGVAFLRDGKMFIGVVRDDLMVRVGPVNHEAALADANVRPMDFTGRPMVGYVYVNPDGTANAEQVRPWVELAWAFVDTVEASPKRSGGRKKAGR